MFVFVTTFALLFSLTPQEGVLGEKAYDFTRQIVEEIGPRPAGSQAIDEAAQKIFSLAKECGLSPKMHTFRQVFRPEIRLLGEQFIAPSESYISGKNVWVRIGNDEAPAIVIGAHYDSVSSTVPGARDNGASVGILFSLACHLSSFWEGKHALVFVAFSGEEENLLGSQAFVNEQVAHPVDLMVSLDVLGDTNLSLNGLSPLVGDHIVNAAFVAAKKEGISLQIPWPQLILSRRFPQAERSDHNPFTHKNIPAFQLYSRGEAGFDPHYHAPSDDFSRVSVETLDAPARLLIRFLLEVDSVAGTKGDGRFFPLSSLILLPGWFVWGFLFSAIGISVLAFANILYRNRKHFSKNTLSVCVSWLIWFGIAVSITLAAFIPFLLAPLISGVSFPWFSSPGWYALWGLSFVLCTISLIWQSDWITSRLLSPDRFLFVALSGFTIFTVFCWYFSLIEATIFFAFPLVFIALCSIFLQRFFRILLILLSLLGIISFLWPGLYQEGMLTWTLSVSSILYPIWAFFVFFFFGAALLGTRKNPIEPLEKKTKKIFLLLSFFSIVIFGSIAISQSAYNKEFARRVFAKYEQTETDDARVRVWGFGGERLDGLTLQIGKETYKPIGKKESIPVSNKLDVINIEEKSVPSSSPGWIEHQVRIQNLVENILSIKIRYYVTTNSQKPISFRISQQNGDEIEIKPPLGYDVRWYEVTETIIDQRKFQIPKDSTLYLEVTVTLKESPVPIKGEGPDMVLDTSAKVSFTRFLIGSS